LKNKKKQKQKQIRVGWDAAPSVLLSEMKWYKKCPTAAKVCFVCFFDLIYSFCLQQTL